MPEAPPRIAFLSRRAYGDTDRKSAVDGVQTLVGLHERGRIEIGPNIVPEALPEFPPQLAGSCNALVCRPTWGGHVTDQLVDFLRAPDEPFFVVTLSSGKSHISAREDADTEVLTGGSGNAEQTAELTVFLAICLLRRMLAPMVNMGFGVYSRPDYTRSRSLDKATWVVVGAGAVGATVLRKAAAMGAGTLWAYDARFSQMTQEEIAKRRKRFGDLKVEFKDDLEEALAGAHVVSLHVPAYDKNIGMVNRKWFELLSTETVLINCARHEIVDDQALVEALEAGSFGGYAADVLPPGSERRGANPHQPDAQLWRRACWSMITSIERCTRLECAFDDFALAERFLEADLDVGPSLAREQSSERNIVYTPHIGGSTLDAENAVSKKAIEDLLDRLGIEP